MDTKYCPTCKKTKPKCFFHKCKSRPDGLQGNCIECKKNWAKTTQGKQAHRKAKRKYKKTDKGKDAEKRYRQSQFGKANLARNGKKFLEKHPHYAKAKRAINHATQRGKIPKVHTLTCIKCGEQAEIYHHHNGYSDKHLLDIVPMCFKHHRIEHAHKSFMYI